MKVSTVLPVAEWADCGPFARAAEQDGFDTLQANELRHDPFVPLALAALATQRIELATSVVIAFPRSPMVVANQAWDLHRASHGRFTLGLGSQVKAHNERRFSTPWVSPAARMADYVAALRAIFACWEHGEKLDYRGPFYNFTLMTPEFTPPRSGFGTPPIQLAAVGPHMLRTAARVADGVRLHGFATRAYLERVVWPILAHEQSPDFEVTGGGFIASGPNDAAVQRAADKVRARVAFYGSTPAYHRVFALHGLEDLGHRLHRLSREGRWAEMPALVSDETLALFCARAPYDGIAEAIAARFGGLVDSVTLDFLPDDDTATRRRVIDAIHRIPHGTLTRG